MSPGLRSLLRTLLLAAGAGIGVVSLLAFRAADWPIYLTFVLVYLCVFLPSVQVLPGLRLPIPNMAVTIGFLYIGGLPIILLRAFAPALMWFGIRRMPHTFPEAWKQRVAQLHVAGATFFWDALGDGSGSQTSVAGEWAMFSIGMAARWWVARALVPDELPVDYLWALAIAEVVGYACWGILSVLPVYPDRPLLPLSEERRGLRSALDDVNVVVCLALTPFVFLIAYGYRAEGLPGASGWALSTLGLHVMLKRMNERRIVLEEQNRRLEALNRELEHRERLSAIGKMSSVVSHQILHQLGVIGIYADLIRNADGAVDADTALGQVRENARAIEGAVRDVNRVVTDLLVFSRDLKLNLYVHPLRRVLEECVEDCRAEATERRVSVVLQATEGIELTIDKLKIKQAIVNVLRNAIEVSPVGAEVVLRAEADDGGALISVSDDGPGVAEQDREPIFAPFFTTKEHGNGLGLAIAREFTQAHGGSLSVEAKPAGPGATFLFRLPAPILERRVG